MRFTILHAHKLFLAAAMLTLAAAFTAEHGFGLKPCEMCWWQRYPYMAAIVVSLTALIAPAPMQRRLLCITLLIFLISAGLGWYHAGVEWRIFEGPTHCSDGPASGASLEELRRMILDKPLVLCNQPAFVFLGLSMAAWNGLWSLALSGLVFVMLRRSKGAAHA